MCIFIDMCDFNKISVVRSRHTWIIDGETDRVILWILYVISQFSVLAELKCRNSTGILG